MLFDDEDLPRALYRLKQSDYERFDVFRYAILTLFPEFEDISVDAYEVRPETKERYGFIDTSLENEDGGEKSIPFHIKDELYKVSVTSRYLNQPVNISMMSTGTKKNYLAPGKRGYCEQTGS